MNHHSKIFYKLQIQDLSHFYKIKANESTKALSNISINNIKSGEICFLLGPNGAGKSTLLNILANRLPLKSGEINFFENNEKRKFPDLRPFYLPQAPHLGIVANLSIIENLILRRSLQLKKFSPYKNKKIVNDLISFLNKYHIGFLVDKLDLLPENLSGGELQILNLMSILFANPQIILMDEPTSKLDERHRIIFMNLLCQAIDNNPSVIIICATHDLDMANRIGNRHIFLENGRLIKEELIRNTDESRNPGAVRYIKHVTDFPYSSPSNDWWDYKPGSLFAEVYYEGDDSVIGYLANRPLTREERTEREVNGILKILNISKNDSYKFLDIPCGWGRHTILLASKGFEVIGVDLNEKFIRLATEEAFRRGLTNVKFHVGDMRTLSELFEEESFDYIINLWTSFGFFDDEDNQRILKSFYGLLKKNGKMVVHQDLNPRRVCYGIFDEPSIRKLRNGKQLIVKEYFCEENRSVLGVWKIEGASREHTYKIRIYDEEEWKLLAERAKFKKINFYSSFDFIRPLDSTSQEFIILLEK